MMLHLLSYKNISQLLLIEESAHVTPWTEDVFERCFDAGYHVWGLEYAEKLIGFVIFSFQVGECHILNLCVHPSHQSQGFGNQLLTHALKQAKEMGAGTAFLEVRRSNVKAASLYKKMGFVQIGERTGYYPATKGREDALVFAKDLGVA